MGMFVIGGSCLVGTMGLLSTTFFSSGGSLFSIDMIKVDRFCAGAGVERLGAEEAGGAIELGRGSSACKCCLGECS